MRQFISTFEIDNLKKKVWTLTLVGLSLICITCSQMSSVAEGNSTTEIVKADLITEDGKRDCITMEFRYLIIENVTQSSNFRRIEVFMNNQAFSVGNLKKLFSHLSNKYPDPKYLTIVVKTDWSQIQLPTDCPGTGSTNITQRADEFDFHRAIYYRRGENIYFRYSTMLKVQEMETVVLQGKAP